MNGVEPFKNVKKNISEIKEHDKKENDSLLKLSSYQNINRILNCKT